MKILIITGTFSPSINGVAISTEILAKNLIKLGHSVLILAPANPETKNDSNVVLRYSSMSNPFVVDYPIPLLPLTPKIYKDIKKFNPDLVHVHHPFHIGFFANLIAEKLKIPLVFTYHTKHDYYANEYFKFLPKDIRPKFIANSVLDFCKKCDLVITPSNEIIYFLRKKGISNTVTIPSIVDDLKKTKLSKFRLRRRLNLPADKKILLFVGRLAIEKNLNILLESMTIISSDYILVVCGSGPLEETIKKKVRVLKLQKRVVLVGRIEREKMGLYYTLADYFYYSSRSETQGLIYWEALSFGLPIVSVDSNVAREWVKNNFGLIAKDDPIDMASKIKEISKKNYMKLSNNALTFSKKFSSNESAIKMVDVYHKLVKGNNLTQKLLDTGWQSWSSDSKSKPRLYYERNYLPLRKEFINYFIDTEVKLKKPITGWISWYPFGRNINERKILNQIEWFGRHKEIPIEYILIDEGYCKWGDWMNIDKIKFPDGFDYLKNRVFDNGMKMGLWVAPFLVEKDSDLYKNHPDWTTTMKNKPVLGIKGSIFDKYIFERYILDIRKRKVREFVFDTIDFILKSGDIKLIKLDFLFCVYFIPNITAVEAGGFIREMFKYIREKYPEVYTIACGAPLIPVMGVVDSMRIGPDTISPGIEKIPLIFKIFNKIRIKEVFKNIDRRLWTNKYWNLDPDVFVCRNNLGFDDKTINKLFNYIKKCNGNIFLGDDITRLPKERIDKYIIPLFKR
ncbi:MAG: glycosyltransferase [bacterium]|nr:glycosyltransferase [bacterium]